MSTNSLTLQHVIDRRSIDPAARFVRKYWEAIKQVNRAILDDDQQAADNADNAARRYAHYAASLGDGSCITDRLCRHYGITD